MSSSDLSACTSDLAQADTLAATLGSPPTVPESPLSAALPAISAIIVGGGLLFLRRRHHIRSARGTA